MYLTSWNHRTIDAFTGDFVECFGMFAIIHCAFECTEISFDTGVIFETVDWVTEFALRMAFEHAGNIGDVLGGVHWGWKGGEWQLSHIAFVVIAVDGVQQGVFSAAHSMHILIGQGVHAHTSITLGSDVLCLSSQGMGVLITDPLSTTIVLVDSIHSFFFRITENGECICVMQDSCAKLKWCK